MFCGRAVPLLLGCLSAPRLVSAGGVAQLVQSAGAAGDRLARKDDVQIVNDFEFDGPTLRVSTARPDQDIIGFGGAFTEAASLMFKSLPDDLKEQVLELYFGEGGAGFTLGRTHINSCDFSPANYAFDDVSGDYDLQHFDNNVTHDTVAMIPFIQAAQQKIRATGRDLKLLAAPWSPPAWMKTNGQMDGSPSPGLKDDAKAAWAKYFSRWISAYKAHGIPIWAVTPQNEPENNARWEACVYTAQQEMDWVGAHLGPTLKADHPEVSIFVFDHNKDHVYDWAKALHQHPTASQYTAGVAFHWYTGDEFDHVAQAHSDFPQAVLLATEATYERYRWKPGTKLADGDWSFGMGYAHDIIGDLNAGASGWITWNLMLDMNGGPNHVDNVCDSAMLTDAKKLYVHPQYYALSHFSKYVLPGSKGLQTQVLESKSYTGETRPYGTCSADDGLQASSFLRPDGQLAVVALNCGDDDIDFKIALPWSGALKATIPAQGIQTYVIPVPAEQTQMIYA